MSSKEPDLGDVIRSLDKKAQGEFSLRLLIATRSRADLLNAAPAVHRVFVEARAQVMEETLGKPSRTPDQASLSVKRFSTNVC